MNGRTEPRTDLRVKILGQAWSKDQNGQPTFFGRTGDRLVELAGLGSKEELRQVFNCANLLDYYPGKAGKGDRFPMKEAREAAAAIRPCLPPLTVLLGRKVAEAFRLPATPLGRWEEWPDRTGAWTVLPHPSGLNRFWNDPQNVQGAKAFMYQLVKQSRFLATAFVAGVELKRCGDFTVVNLRRLCDRPERVAV